MPLHLPPAPCPCLPAHTDALAGLTSLAKDWGGHMAEARQRLQQQLVTDLEAQGSTLTGEWRQHQLCHVLQRRSVENAAG